MRATRTTVIAAVLTAATVLTGCLKQGEDYRLDHPVHEDQHGPVREHNAVVFGLDASEDLGRIYRNCGGNARGGNPLTMICTARGFDNWIRTTAGGTQDLVVYRAFQQSIVDGNLPLWRDALAEGSIAPVACYRLPWTPWPDPASVAPC
jgi:hypothetical protein